MIDGDRLYERLYELGQLGMREDGGLYCLALTTMELTALELTACYMEEAGLRVRYDKAGNLIGRLEGSDKTAPAVMTGSHVDSVYGGGIFDGRLGVLGGIEAAAAIKKMGIGHTHPIEVCVFRDQQGVRFSGSYCGSGYMTGQKRRNTLGCADKQGITVEEALRRLGINPDTLDEARLPEGYAKSFVELHIEQGRILEKAGVPIGIVTGIQSQIRGKFIFKGQFSHGGTVKMEERHDALMAAAEVMLELERITRQKKTAVVTIGCVDVKPGSINTVPGNVEFTVDVRDASPEVRDSIIKKAYQTGQEICERRGVSMEFYPFSAGSGWVSCSRDIQEVIAEGIEENGMEPYYLASMAGHDSGRFAKICPMGMIFVRSIEGRSFCKEEWSSKEDCALGAEILCRTLIKLAE
ncbi:Zn-dependent hydrolase [Lachnospiraceae bacterium 62-35]